MPNITIPKTIEGAKAALDGIGALLTAKRWERAAITYAFTDSTGRAGRPPKSRVSRGFSIAEFARLTGSSERQVGEYRKAWESAAAEIGNDGMLAVQPGDAIDTDDLPPWKDHFGEPTVEVQERVARAYIAKNPEVVVEAVKALPGVADAVVTAVVEDRDLGDLHAAKSFAVATGRSAAGVTPRAVPPSTIPTFEREKALAKAIEVIDQAIKDEAAGTFDPGVGNTVLLFILTRELNERATRIVGAQPVIHAEIDAFLAAARKDAE